ncbi:MAG: hypothetical protein OK452_11100, partial [Thaumarchaeota archaeon]|nr:hypothetical protein [Nitrososphaerota archaeon]
MSPGGNITWSSTGPGGWYPRSCDSGVEIHTFIDLKCTSYYVPTSLASPVLIEAKYEGDSNNLPATGSTTLAVTTSPTSALVNCFPSTVPVGLVATCTVYLSYNMYSIVDYPGAGPPPPTGTIQWSSSGGDGGLNSTACSFPHEGSEKCTATFTPFSSASPVTITANYLGNGFYQPTSSSYHLIIAPGRTSNSTSPGATGGGLTLPNYWPAAVLFGVGGGGVLGYYYYSSKKKENEVTPQI